MSNCFKSDEKPATRKTFCTSSVKRNSFLCSSVPTKCFILCDAEHKTQRDSVRSTRQYPLRTTLKQLQAIRTSSHPYDIPVSLDMNTVDNNSAFTSLKELEKDLPLADCSINCRSNSHDMTGHTFGQRVSPFCRKLLTIRFIITGVGGWFQR